MKYRKTYYLNTVILTAILALTGSSAFSRTIADAVENELVYDPITSAYQILVSQDEDVITLKGSVDSLLEKRRAEQLAQTVRGVVFVENRIVVNPPRSRTDPELKQDINNRWMFNPGTESYDLNVTVDDGKATLSGNVDSYAESVLAESVAAQVAGIKSIVNLIDVNFRTGRSDAEIAEEINNAFYWDVLIPSDNIDVEVDDGVVTLEGTVNNYMVKNKAILAANVAGVKEVDAEELGVSPDVSAGIGTDEVSDVDIRRAVDNSLIGAPGIDRSTITVHVDDGRVTLRGTVDNIEQRRDAEYNTRYVSGVNSVENRLRVADSVLTDSQMETRAKNILMVDATISEYDLDVNVVNDVARLTGTVDTYYEKIQAENAVAGVEGIKEIKNRLQVSDSAEPLSYDPLFYPWSYYPYTAFDYSPPYNERTDEEIKDSIESELWWSPFVDSDNVNVKVDDGVATLTGEVSGKVAYDAAQENAYEGGAVWVDNDLRVAYD